MNFESFARRQKFLRNQGKPKVHIVKDPDEVKMPDENCGKAVGFVKDHPTYGTHKLLVKNGEMMWAGSDLARALGYADPDDAIRRHCKYAKLYKPGDLPGLEIGPRGMYFIPESDVYRLILKSQMPKAVEIQDWVVEEVVPPIR